VRLSHYLGMSSMTVERYRQIRNLLESVVEGPLGRNRSGRYKFEKKTLSLSPDGLGSRGQRASFVVRLRFGILFGFCSVICSGILRPDCNL
jgi:hypothetical protein